MTLREWIIFVIGAIAGVGMVGAFVIGAELRRQWGRGGNGIDPSIREHLKSDGGSRETWGGGTKW